MELWNTKPTNVDEYWALARDLQAMMHDASAQDREKIALRLASIRGGFERSYIRNAATPFQLREYYPADLGGEFVSIGFDAGEMRKFRMSIDLACIPLWYQRPIGYVEYYELVWELDEALDRATRLEAPDRRAHRKMELIIRRLKGIADACQRQLYPSWAHGSNEYVLTLSGWDRHDGWLTETAATGLQVRLQDMLLKLLPRLAETCNGLCDEEPAPPRVVSAPAEPQDVMGTTIRFERFHRPSSCTVSSAVCDFACALTNPGTEAFVGKIVERILPVVSAGGDLELIEKTMKHILQTEPGRSHLFGVLEQGRHTSQEIVAFLANGLRQVRQDAQDHHLGLGLTPAEQARFRRLTQE